MKLTLHKEPDLYIVRAYAPGRLELAEQVLTAPLLISPSRLSTEWEAAQIGELEESHLAEVLSWEPDVLVLGTGERQLFPPAQLIARLAQRSIGLEVMGTAAACRTYNVLAVDGRNVAAALIV